MEGSEYLLTSAEVAVALAGFSALIVAIQQRNGEELPGAYRGVVATLIERSLVAALLAFLPLLLAGLGTPPSRLWLVASGLLAAYAMSLAWRGVALRQRDAFVGTLLSGPLFSLLYACGIAVIVLQLAHALGLGLEQGVWWYLVGLTWLLSTVGYLFYLVIRGWARDG